MATENNSLNPDSTSISTELTPTASLNANPVSEFEDSKRSLLQRSLASAHAAIQAGSSNNISLPLSAQTDLTASRSFRANPSTVRSAQRGAPEVSTAGPSEQLSTQDTEEEESLSGWGRIGRGFSSFWGGVCRIGRKVANADWKSIGTSCLKAGEYVATSVYRGAAYVVTHPRETIDLALKAGKVVGNILLEVGKSVVQEVKNAITDPIGTAKRFGSFLKNLSDQIGLSDLVSGAYHLSAAGTSLLILDFDGAGKHFKESTRAAAGALIMLGEFTGISDLGRAFIALSNGELGKAAFYGALGAAQVYFIITTFGLGNIMSKQGVEAMKQGVRVLARDTGKEVVEELEKKITNGMLEKAGEKIALVTERLVMRDWAQIARNLFANVKKIAQDVAEKITEKLMRDNGAKEIVVNATDKLLEKISESSTRELAKELAEQGIKLKEAHYMAKCLKKGLLRKGMYSRYHNLLAEEIIDEITGQVKENFMDRGLRKGFESSWRDAVQRIISAKGLDENAAELLFKAGREGFEEGVEAGIRKVVREGVEESFNKFRKKTWWFMPKGISGENKGFLDEIDALAEKEEKLTAKKKKDRRHFKRRKPEEEEAVRGEDGTVKVHTKEEIDKKYLDFVA